VTGVGYTSCLKARELWHIWMARVIHSGHVGDLSWCHWIYLVNIFQRCWWYPHRSFGVSLRSFFLFLWEKKQRSKKKISKIQWSFGDYTSSTVRKISMKWIQQHKKRLQTVTEVGYTSCLKARELWHIWMARVTHSGHVGDLSWCHWIYLVNIFQRCWWYPHRSFGVSLRSFFFISFFDFLSPLSYFFNYKLYQFIFRIDVIFLNILNNIFFKC